MFGSLSAHLLRTISWSAATAVVVKGSSELATFCPHLRETEGAPTRIGGDTWFVENGRSLRHGLRAGGGS